MVGDGWDGGGGVRGEVGGHFLDSVGVAVLEGVLGWMSGEGSVHCERAERGLVGERRQRGTGKNERLSRLFHPVVLREGNREVEK